MKLAQKIHMAARLKCAEMLLKNKHLIDDEVYYIGGSETLPRR